MTTNVENNGLDERFSLADDKFMMAFAMEIFEGENINNDPRYVKWIVRTWEKSGAKRVEKYYPLYPCDETDLSKFYTAENEQVKEHVAQIIDDKSLMCLHPELRKFDLFGA